MKRIVIHLIEHNQSYKHTMKNIILSLLFFGLIASISAQNNLYFKPGESKNVTQTKSCVSGEQLLRIKTMLKKNETTLLAKGLLNNPISKQSIVLFDLPIRKSPNLDFDQYYVTRYFVDHNLTAAGVSDGASNLDYNCGRRTYDATNGYNHTGTDFVLYPFQWYLYENNLVEVIAAEAGTVVGIDDGQVDNNCSCATDLWNAVYLRHADGSHTWYGHLKSDINLTVGQNVNKGDFLGYIGSSGCSFAPHLHFQVYDANDNLIDPYSGNCNNMNTQSWWADQENYYESGINAILTHNVEPVLGCQGTEATNFSNIFYPAETVYIGFYYRDQLAGVPSTLHILRPDNTVFDTINLSSPMDYVWSYWWYDYVLPNTGPFGTWTVEAIFQGKTYTHQFQYLDDSPIPGNCDEATNNVRQLSGIQNVSATFETNRQIESTQTIVSENNIITVEYNSGNGITLMPQFSVENNVNFRAYTDGCQNNCDDDFVLSNTEINNLCSVGIDAYEINNMILAVENNEYPNIHSVLIAKDGNTVLNRYFAGEDERWGIDLGLVNHNENMLHDVRSVSKSVVSACVGIAIARGEIDNVNQLVFDFFPGYNQYNTGAKANVSIQHLLTMSAGLQWDETLSYTNPANSETQMIYSGNPIEYILSQPLANTPGTLWNYSGGCTQLLASIIQQVSGMDVYQYAQQHLFNPLGISNSEWATYPGSNLSVASGGLRLQPSDMLKIGQLYLNNGNWQGNQVIQSSWINDSFTNHINTIYTGDSYSYQFWLWNQPILNNDNTVPMVGAVGNGDQRIFVDETNQMVIVTTAGNYNAYQSNNSVALLRDFVYPAVY